MESLSSTMVDGEVLWTPPATARTDFEIGRFMSWVERRHGYSFASYDDLWR